MEPDKQIEQQPRLTSRRSRKDQQGRDYICGCGKKYLSYPALYTHIKTKHDGVQPEGTQKSVPSSSSKRPKSKMGEQILQQLLNLLDKKDLKILDELNGNFQGSISILDRIRKDILPRQLYQYFNSQMIKISSFKMTASSSVDMVLISFLMNVGEYVSEQLYVHFLWFVKILRNCFYEYGGQIYESMFKQSRDIDVFNINECRYLVIVMDFMVRYYLPLDYPHININIIELIICDFSKWMLKLKLTPITIRYAKAGTTTSNNSWRHIPTIHKHNHNDHIEEDDDQSHSSNKSINSSPSQIQSDSDKNSEILKNMKSSRKSNEDKNSLI